MSIETVVTWLLWNKWPVLAFAAGFLIGRRKTYNYNVRGDGRSSLLGLVGFILVIAVGTLLLGGWEVRDLWYRFQP